VWVCVDTCVDARTVCPCVRERSERKIFAIIEKKIWSSEPRELFQKEWALWEFASLLTSRRRNQVSIRIKVRDVTSIWHEREGRLQNLVFLSSSACVRVCTCARSCVRVTVYMCTFVRACACTCMRIRGCALCLCVCGCVRMFYGYLFRHKASNWRIPVLSTWVERLPCV
jgi:hypothetical protein